MAAKQEYKRDSLVWGYDLAKQLVTVHRRSGKDSAPPLRTWDFGKLPEAIRVQNGLVGMLNVLRDSGAKQGVETDEERLGLGDARYLGFVRGMWERASDEVKYELLRKEVAEAFDSLGRDDSFEEYVAGKVTADTTEEAVVRQMAMNEKIAVAIAALRAKKVREATGAKVDFNDL